MKGFLRQRGNAWELLVYLGTDPVIGKQRYTSRSVSGRVEAGALEALLSGRDPTSGTRLGRELVDRYKPDGRVVKAVSGFDATCLGAEVGVGVLGAHRRPSSARRPRCRRDGGAGPRGALRVDDPQFGGQFAELLLDGRGPEQRLRH